MSKVIVIGGGAAGMMAAYSAALCGHTVTLLEKNEKLGKKIYITGKGRCNFTNACDVEEFLKNVVSNPKFLYSALYTLDSYGMIDFIESNGTKTKVERGNRAFPESDHASDITHAISKALREQRVDICLNTKVASLIITNDKVCGVKLSDNTTIEADAVIIATGGLSYKTTGSDGDGLKFAKAAGIKVTDTRPALVPFNCQEEYVKALQGLSLKNVSLKIYNDQKKLYDAFGEMLFTHFGVSGPLVLSASSDVGKHLQGNKLRAEIDLKPALNTAQLEERIIKELSENSNKNFENILRGLLPSSMVPVFMELLEVSKDLKCNVVTKEIRGKLISLLKAFPFTIISLRDYNEAIVTAGGVAVSEINPSTMESKKIEGLYFSGEVIDVDAYTGGFNLQIAFSTGYLAGLNVR